MTAATPSSGWPMSIGIANAECRQHMRRIGRTAASDESDRIEVAKQEDGRKQGQDQIELASSGNVTWVKRRRPVAPSTLAAS